MSKWRLAVATATSLAGSLLLGRATPSIAPPGGTISLVGRPDHGYSPGHESARFVIHVDSRATRADR